MGLHSPQIMVEQLEEPAKNILTQMVPYIEGDTHGLLVGDDCSGRLPALLLRKVLRSLSKEKNHSNLQTIFLGPRALWDDEQHAQAWEVLRRNCPQGKRMLLTTDIVFVGSNSAPFLSFLREKTDQFDLAIFFAGLRSVPDRIRTIMPMDNIFVGSYDYTYYLSDRTKAAGVRKKDDTSLYAQVDRSDPALLTECRQEIHKLSAKLVDWYREMPRLA